MKQSKKTQIAGSQSTKNSSSIPLLPGKSIVKPRRAFAFNSPGINSSVHTTVPDREPEKIPKKKIEKKIQNLCP